MRYDSVDKNINEIYKYMETIYLNNFIESLDKKIAQSFEKPWQFQQCTIFRNLQLPELWSGYFDFRITHLGLKLHTKLRYDSQTRAVNFNIFPKSNG